MHCGIFSSNSASLSYQKIFALSTSELSATPKFLKDRFSCQEQEISVLQMELRDGQHLISATCRKLIIFVCTIFYIILYFDVLENSALLFLIISRLSVAVISRFVFEIINKFESDDCLELPLCLDDILQLAYTSVSKDIDLVATFVS